jgi:ribosomal protein L29
MNANNTLKMQLAMMQLARMALANVIRRTLASIASLQKNFW